MTAPLRQPLEHFVGTIAPCVATAQTITSPLFTTLPTHLSVGCYVPAEIVDETTGASELIRIVGADGSTTATVIRGVEGTSPLTWDQPATIRCAPTVYDLLQVVPRPDVFPTDLHVGGRVLAASEPIVREQTARQGAIPTVRGSVRDMPRTLVGLPNHLADEHMRIKAISFGPIVTTPAGQIRVWWDDGAANFTYQQNAPTEPPTLRYVAFIQAQAHLVNSALAWWGDIAVNLVLGPPWWAQLLCFLPDKTTPLANQQVNGTLLVVGA